MTTTSVKVKVVALALFLATAATVALVPEHPVATPIATIPVTPIKPIALTNERAKIEVVQWGMNRPDGQPPAKANRNRPGAKKFKDKKARK